jgi:hypothetical protein
VIAGVVVAVATVPVKPLAVTTDALVTVPDPEITRLPDPKIVLPLIVLILVVLTSVSCLPDKAVAVAVDTGLLASEVFSALPRPTSDLVIVTLALRGWPLTVVVFKAKPLRS